MKHTLRAVGLTLVTALAASPALAEDPPALEVIPGPAHASNFEAPALFNQTVLSWADGL